MDRSQIITLVVNAVITILTTAVVTKLSLNKGSLGDISKLTAKVTPKVAAYIKLVLALLATGWLSVSLYRFVAAPNQESVTRADALTISIYTAVILVGFGNTLYTLVEIWTMDDKSPVVSRFGHKKEG